MSFKEFLDTDEDWFQFPFEDQVFSDLIGLLPLAKDMCVFYFFSCAVVFSERLMRTFLGSFPDSPLVAALSVVTSSI